MITYYRLHDGALTRQAAERRFIEKRLRELGQPVD